ncbi:MAG: endonuclease Q family protein [Candidatus Pacebacteria bacterium]|nr:endonuclease Q family protein [Candidatus Paceibacterota bacterium]
MRIIADFHIHSKYSRATSKSMDLEHLDEAAKVKGISVISTGDFTHPLWFKELKDNLRPSEPGLYVLKARKGDLKGTTRFILTTEISCIYSKNGRVRKVHAVIFAPDLSAVEKINSRLSAIGNLKADGRPILGLDVKELAAIVLDASHDCFVVPAHLMTPWFSLFGSKSGFDSLEECFEEYSPYIFAGETGLSADPAMLWRMPDSRRIALISCSDAHSAEKIGREACVFDAELSYPAIIDAIKSKDSKKFLFTIEFFPEEGKYHYDGHRACGVRLSPVETRKYHGICPVCGRPLTVGVLSRVEELADRPEGFAPDNVVPYKSLVPLREVISASLGVGPASKQVARVYDNLIKKFGSELNILLDIPLEELKQADHFASRAVERMRSGKIMVEPGYDGVYGRVNIFSDEEKKDFRASQRQLF